MNLSEIIENEEPEDRESLRAIVEKAVSEGCDFGAARSKMDVARTYARFVLGKCEGIENSGKD